MAGPDAYFEKRGFLLRVERRNLDDELPKYAQTRGSTHWADLVSIRTGEVFAPNYGCGMSAEEAKERARRRYIVEQGSEQLSRCQGQNVAWASVPQPARRCVNAALQRFDNVSFVPPDPPLSDGVIILRPMDESDLPTIERAASDAEILKSSDLHTRSPADYLAAKREAWAEGTGASFAICDATRPDTCRGQVFIERDDDGRGSVGYWLLEDGRGKGRATRAVRLMASWALPEMRLGRLQLHTDPENVASQRVAERAGFTREGVFRAYNARRDGTRADAFVYSLLPQDLAPARFANSS